MKLFNTSHLTRAWFVNELVCNRRLMVSFKDPLGGVRADLEVEGRFDTDKGVKSGADGVNNWGAAALLLNGTVAESNETDAGVLNCRVWNINQTKSCTSEWNIGYQYGGEKL